jgi:hypothetical protein
MPDYAKIDEALFWAKRQEELTVDRGGAASDGTIY